MFCNNNTLNDLITECGKEYGIGKEESHKIARHQFKVMRDKITSMERTNTNNQYDFRLWNLGLFRLRKSLFNKWIQFLT
jgi:hypothetical protein